ncbi:threonine/serine exporter family protein [Fusobacterium sp. PH5-44]|uniref:threonine/serine exporter family protein n=1 Tax=unclassified Fusobacterium TaxID=2648384 RepID=UPI003D1F7AB7
MDINNVLLADNTIVIGFAKEILLAMIAAFGFGILFGLKEKKMLLAASISGGIGWFFYILCLHIKLADSIGYLMGALSMTIYSEILARKLKAPAITFLIGGLIPLVPGSGVYYTMFNLINNDFTNAMIKGIETIICAGSIAAGILIGSTICQLFYRNIKTKKQV